MPDRWRGKAGGRTGNAKTGYIPAAEHAALS
jgi:hypothetical protein